MAKVRVQDATKELSTGAAKMLENVSRLRRNSQDVLNSLRRISDDFAREEAAQKQREAQEKQKAQYADAAEYMSAYSSEKPEEKPAPEPKPAPEKPAVQEAPAQSEKAPEKAEPKPAPEAKPEKAEPKADRGEPKSEKPAPAAEEKAPAQAAAPAPAQEARPAARQPRPAQGAQQGQQGRPAPAPRQGDFRQGTQGQPGAPRPFNRPQQGDFRQGTQGQPGGPRPFNRGPQQGNFQQGAQGGQPGGPRPFNRGPQQGNFQQGGQPGGPRPFNRGPQQGNFQQGAQGGQPGGPRPFNRGPQQGGFNRPAGGGTGAPRTGGGSFQRRSPVSDLTPTAEKERVSNYDPKAKQYVRQKDPENAATKSRMKTRESVGGGLDDEFVRGGKRKKKAPEKPVVRPEPVVIDHAVMTSETITVRDLSEKLGKPANEIIKQLMMLDILSNINAELDYDTANLVASEFGITLEKKVAESAEDILEQEAEAEDKEESLVPRPPVVTIMGHVDHGKTSLLDYIRQAKVKVTSTEAGGITQAIGAYTVEQNGRRITFLDTPGHEAFTAMRMRGAQATDIAILVVAADDGVMPQTVEAIHHAQAAGVQIIVAINKMDKVGANPDRIRQQLTEYNMVDESWGGDTIMVPVSAITGEGVDQLLEMVLLVAEMQDYRANPDRKARGIIIEARLDKGRGPVATVLVKNGTLHVGDTVVAGTAYGRVRAMMSPSGERVKSAGPSEPVEVIGFGEVPDAGDTITAVDDDKLSRQVAEERRDRQRAALIKTQQKTTLDDLFSQISSGEVKDLNIIIKADVQGSVEAVRQSLEKLTNEEVRVRSIHGGVGAITETDVMLASASNAIIIGFNVRPDSNAKEIAEREKIDIRLYRVIYDAIEDVQKAMKGMLAPKFEENIIGHAEVRQTYRISGVGTIAGSYVTDGKIARNAGIRLLRDNVVVHEGKIDSLKRFKDDAREVAQGYECGIGIERYNDIKVGDVIECYQMEEIEQ